MIIGVHTLFAFRPLLRSSVLPIFLSLRVRKETTQLRLLPPWAILGTFFCVVVDPHRLISEKHPHFWFCETGLGAFFSLSWGRGSNPWLCGLRNLWTLGPFGSNRDRWMDSIDTLSYRPGPQMTENVFYLNLEIQFCIHLGPSFHVLTEMCCYSPNMDVEIVWCKRTVQMSRVRSVRYPYSGKSHSIFLAKSAGGSLICRLKLFNA